MKTSSTKKGRERLALALATPVSKTWNERTFEQRIRYVAIDHQDDLPVSGTLAAAAADLRVTIRAIEHADEDGCSDEVMSLLLRVAMRVEAAQAETHRLELAARKAGEAIR